MKKTRYMLLAVLLVASGVMGGLASSGLFGPQTAKAVTEITAAKTIRLADTDGNFKMLLTTTSDNAPNIIFTDNNSKLRALYGLSKNGEPMVIFDDKKETMRVIVAVTDKDGPAIELYDKNEKTIWSKP